MIEDVDLARFHKEFSLFVLNQAALSSLKPTAITVEDTSGGLLQPSL
jgi:hypothetical protein